MYGGSLIQSAVTEVTCDFSLPVDLTITVFAPFLSDGILEVVGGFKTKTTVPVLCSYGDL